MLKCLTIKPTATEIKTAGSTHSSFLLETKTGVPGDGEFIGVPGELRGFETAWKKYGSLPWKDLFGPAIDIATKGFKATPALVLGVRQNAVNVTNDPGLRLAKKYGLSSYAPHEQSLR